MYENIWLDLRLGSLDVYLGVWTFCCSVSGLVSDCLELSFGCLDLWFGFLDLYLGVCGCLDLYLSVGFVFGVSGVVCWVSGLAMS